MKAPVLNLRFLISMIVVVFAVSSQAASETYCEMTFPVNFRDKNSRVFIEGVDLDKPAGLSGMLPTLIKPPVKIVTPETNFYKNPGRVARQRYQTVFRDAYSDQDLSLLKKSNVYFRVMKEGQFAGVAFRADTVQINTSLKDHPFYPVVHSHEIQHQLDDRNGNNRNNSALEILETEIRAFNREYEVFKRLFSKEEFDFMIQNESDRDIRERMQVMQSVGSAENYIVDSLVHGPSYVKAIQTAYYSSGSNIGISQFVANKIKALTGKSVEVPGLYF